MLIPAGIGAVVTVILLAKAVDALFDRFYPYAFHAIIGIVIAATIMIVPVGTFLTGGGRGACLHRVGIAAAWRSASTNPRAGRLRRAFKKAIKKLSPGRGELFAAVIRFWGSGCPARAC